MDRRRRGWVHRALEGEMIAPRESSSEPSLALAWQTARQSAARVTIPLRRVRESPATSEDRLMRMKRVRTGSGRERPHLARQSAQSRRRTARADFGTEGLVVTGGAPTGHAQARPRAISKAETRPRKGRRWLIRRSGRWEATRSEPVDDSLALLWPRSTVRRRRAWLARPRTLQAPPVSGLEGRARWRREASTEGS
jgi:hypothetical protein